MFHKLFTTKGMLTLLLGVLLLVPLAARADDIEAKGTIEAIGTDSLVVQGMTFWVNDQTRIKDDNGMSLQMSDLAVGDYVEVEGYQHSDGKVYARKIERKRYMHGDDSEMEVKGRIQEKDSVSIVVQGVRFYVDASTMIKKDHQMLTFDDLTVGQFVEVEAYWMNDHWVAYKIEVEDDFDEIEVKGMIEAIGGDSLVVKGFVFYVDSNTVIKGDHDSTLDFSDLAVGDYVEVKAYRDASGRLIARKIEREDASDDHDAYRKMEIEGRITHLTDSSMVVNDIYIMFSPTTEFYGHDDMPFSRDSLKVGMYVEVKVQLNNNGVWVAIKVEVKSREGMEYYVEMEGQVSDIGTDYFVVNGVTFFVDANTQFYGDDHTPLTFSDLQVNDWVEVKAREQADGSLLAIKVKVESSADYQARVEIEGIVDTVYTDAIVVNGITIQVDTTTIIVDKFGTRYTLADLTPGMRVEVKAIVDNNGTYFALRIKVKDLWSPYFEVKAQIDSIVGNTLYIMGQAIQVTDSTVIKDENGNPVDVSYLTAGIWVKIYGQILDDGTLIALKIKVKDAQTMEVEFTAAIDSVASNGIYVNGYFFLVNDQTEILGLQREPLSLSDLQAGMIVEIKAVLQADGSFLAVRIKVEDKPGVARMNGVMDGKTDSYLMLGNNLIQVTPNTIFLDADYNPVTFQDLAVGTPVVVITDNNATGTTEALQVQEAVPGQVTGITDQQPVTVVSEFILEQNYPNPFNPSTTIPLRIAGTEWHQVQLIIYNALGQQVAVLFNGALQGGSYQFTWNGRNQANRPVPSGIYFYQLRVDQQVVATRKMILMK